MNAFGALGFLLTLLARGLADLLLPPVCPACRAAVATHEALCAKCWAGIRFIEAPVCPVHGTPFGVDLGAGMVSAEALADPPPFRRARAAAIYDGAAKRLIHEMKYRDRPELAGVLAAAMVRAGRELLADCDLLVPVPLHRWRLWRRRFNQSAKLAVQLGASVAKPVELAALVRVRATRRQVGLTAVQRDDNVRGAFRVPDAARIRIAGRGVLLVDDVYTSGATVKAAVRALKRAGAAHVDVLTFARVTN